MNSADVNAYIRKHYKKEDDHLLAKRFKMSVGAIQSRRLRMGCRNGTTVRPTAIPFEDDIQERTDKRSRQADEKRYLGLLSRYEALQRTHTAALELRAHEPDIRILEARRGKNGEAKRL